MADIVLLTEQRFKELVPVATNLNISNPIKQSIITAQDRYIKNLFCDAFWTEIQTAAGTSPIPSPFDDLIEEIRKPLAWYSFYIMLIYSVYHSREMGTVKQTGDRSETIANEDLTYIRQDALSAAQTFEIQLKKYLNDNLTLFPGYNDCSCDCGSSDSISSTRRFFFNV